MKRKVLDTLCIGMMAMGVSTAGAFEVNQVRIIRIESANSAGHTWVAISGPSNCATQTSYFIIDRWDNQAEPLQTARKQMYQLAVAALAAGKNIRVVGATCYLNQYLFADQLTVYE